MEITLTRNGTCSIVHIFGGVDLYSSPKLRGTVLNLFCKQEQQRVLSDLSEVSYIDSSDIVSLAATLAETTQQGTRAILIGRDRGSRHVPELTRLLNVFEVAATEQEALA